MSTTIRVPSYRLHKPSGKAVVTLSGQDVYLGPFGSPESKAEYERVVAEWLARGRPAPSENILAGPTVNDILLAYARFAEIYYRDALGRAASEVKAMKPAFRLVRLLYGEAPAREFGPVALKAVRQKMIETGWCRGVINQRTGHIKRAFKWAAGEELIPPEIFHGLQCVPGLRRGRSEARETEPVQPVPDPHVDAVLPFMSPTVQAMVRLQRLTGMRSGELVLLRKSDIDMTGAIWLYRPPMHKTAHHGHARAVPIGPLGQEVIRPYLTGDPQAYVFSPARAVAEQNAIKRAARETRVQPSQLCRKRRNPKKLAGERYDRCGYYRAVRYAIEKARRAGVDVPLWHPHQLRHNAATRIRKQRESIDRAKDQLRACMPRFWNHIEAFVVHDGDGYAYRPDKRPDWLLRG